MTKCLVIFTVFLALASIASAATQSDALDLAPNPPNCPVGYRCLTLKEYGQMTYLYVKTQDERDALRLRLKQRQVLGGKVAPFVLSGVLFDAGDSARSPFIFGGVRIWKFGLQGGVYSRNGEARFGTEFTFYHEW